MTDGVEEEECLHERILLQCNACLLARLLSQSVMPGVRVTLSQLVASQIKKYKYTKEFLHERILLQCLFACLLIQSVRCKSHTIRTSCALVFHLKHTNTNTQIQILKYKYINTNTQIQISQVQESHSPN